MRFLWLTRPFAAMQWIALAVLQFIVNFFNLVVPYGAARAEFLRNARGSAVCPMVDIGPSRFPLLRLGFQSCVAYFWFEYSM